MGKTLLLILFFIFFSNISLSQKVYNKTALLKLEKYNTISNDGILTFEVEVRISDCISYIEINDVLKLKKNKNIWDKLYDWWWFKVRKIYDFNIAKTYTKPITEENYYLKESDDLEPHIVMRCELMSLKSLYGRKSTRKKIEINLYSMSGKVIYSKIITLRKSKIIQNSEVRLGVEPS